MVHEYAKDLLRRAATHQERVKAVEETIAMGMPLHQIEEYLDYLDATGRFGHQATAEPVEAAPRRAGASDRLRSRRRKRRWTLAWKPLARAAVAAGLLVGLTVVAIRLHHARTAGRVPPPVYVARLGGTVAARWSDGRSPAEDGRLAAGREVSLREGLAEILFDRGASVIFQGPGVFEPQSPRSGRLSQGALSARVPPQSAGFTIDTPGATVVDLGTEFGVAVEPSGLSEVEVFAGNVEVRPADSAGPAGPGGRLATCPTSLRAGEAVRLALPAGGGRVQVERIAAGARHFVRSLADSVGRLRALVGADPRLIHHYPFEGRTVAEKCRDWRGDLDLSEVAMRDGDGGGGIDYACPGPFPVAKALRPFRADHLGNSHGVGLQSRMVFHPPKAMTVELLLSYGGGSDLEEGMVSAAVCTRAGSRRCAFFVAALDDGRLVHLMDGRAAWLESGFEFVPGNWYYVASTFQVQGEQTIVNTYVADLGRGERTLSWVVRDQSAPGVAGPSRLGIGKGFDGEAANAYPWSGALDEVAIYAAVLDRSTLQAHLAALVGEVQTGE